jgi:hypothetical protein
MSIRDAMFGVCLCLCFCLDHDDDAPPIYFGSAILNAKMNAVCVCVSDFLGVLGRLLSRKKRY